MTGNPARSRRHGLGAMAAWSLAALVPGLSARRAQAAPQPQPWPKAKPTPAVQLPQLDGPTWALAEQRGNAVVMNFWAGWCAPCRAEMPSLELAATRFEAEGLLVVAVNFKEGEAAVRRHVADWNLSLPVLRDGDAAVARAFGVRLLPSTVLIGRDGRVRSTVFGEVDWGVEPATTWLQALLRT